MAAHPGMPLCHTLAGGEFDSIYPYVMQSLSFIPFGWQDIYFMGGHSHDTLYGGPCLVY